jgi:hypothetical protein
LMSELAQAALGATDLMPHLHGGFGWARSSSLGYNHGKADLTLSTPTDDSAQRLVCAQEALFSPLGAAPDPDPPLRITRTAQQATLYRTRPTREKTVLCSRCCATRAPGAVALLLAATHANRPGGFATHRIYRTPGSGIAQAPPSVGAQNPHPALGNLVATYITT